MKRLEFLCQEHFGRPAKDLEDFVVRNQGKCTADIRIQALEEFPVIKKAKAPQNTKELLETSIKYGGLKPGYTFEYETFFGKQTARVCGLYDVPENLVNPIWVVFSGALGAGLMWFDGMRIHSQKAKKFYPALSIGKGGNKGFYGSLYDNSKKGIIIGSETEYGAYLNIMEKFAPSSYVRQNQRAFEDTDTAGNLRELYRFAQMTGLKEVTYLLISGQPWYDVRVMSEFTFPFYKNPQEFKDVKVNFVLVHCPLYLDGALPELSESLINLGYAGASTGPILRKIMFPDGTCFCDDPERFFIMEPRFASRGTWTPMKTVITEHNFMGWPDALEQLYEIGPVRARMFIFISYMLANASYTAEEYEEAMKDDIHEMDAFYMGTCHSLPPLDNEENNLRWCINSTDEHFFKED